MFKKYTEHLMKYIYCPCKYLRHIISVDTVGFDSPKVLEMEYVYFAVAIKENKTVVKKVLFVAQKPLSSSHMGSFIGNLDIW